jgi:hypothetical protein
MASFTAFLYFNPFKKSEFAIMVAALSAKASSEISTPSKTLGIAIPKCFAKS